MKTIPENPPEKELLKAFEAAGVVEYLEYLQSGKRIMWTNFKAGIAKGFGITIGMTVVLGVFYLDIDTTRGPARGRRIFRRSRTFCQ